MARVALGDRDDGLKFRRRPINFSPFRGVRRRKYIRPGGVKSKPKRRNMPVNLFSAPKTDNTLVAGARPTLNRTLARLCGPICLDLRSVRGADRKAAFTHLRADPDSPAVPELHLVRGIG